MKVIRLLVLAVLCGLAAMQSNANNVTVTNLILTNIDTTNKTLNAQFDIQWDNSWFLNPANSPGNHDAIWLVLKYHIGDNNWRTASLDTNAVNHVAPAGFTIKIARNGTSGVGAMLHRSSSGSGTALAPGVKIKWLFGNDGVSNSALISAEVHAIEMVFVPSNAFRLGDGTSNTVFRSGSTFSPFLVSSATINAGTNPGLLRVGISQTNASYSIPSTYPSGLSDFYMMKYEASMEQAVDFQNKAAPIGALINDIYQHGRGALSGWGSEPNLYTAAPNRAASVGAFFFLQYLDFVCLRPLTELEYEKACRGTANPVAGEYAWGTAIAATLPYALASDGTPNESVASNYNENAGNCWYYRTQPPLSVTSGTCRVGMFAKASYNGSTSARIQSGAGFYGAMDLTGNGNELVIRAPTNSTDAVITNFFGNHGDGVLGPDNSTMPWLTTWLVNRGGSCSLTINGFSSLTNDIVSVSRQGTSVNGSAIRGARSLIGP